MAVTIKQISEISGVSRGTVDRVLNGRGRVRPETEALVRRVAEQLGYRPNLAGKALAARKKSYCIGVLLTAEGVPFFDEVIRGVRTAETELAEYDVRVALRTIKGYRTGVQLRAIAEMEEEVSALIFNPINDPAVEAKMGELHERGVAVVTVNTDIPGAPKLCHIGPDYNRNGETAAGMMRLLLGAGPRSVAVFSGSREIGGHRRRVEGFARVLEHHRPDWRIVGRAYTEDDDVIAYERAARCFAEHPEVDGVYIAAAGTYGVCRGVMGAFPGKKPVIVCSDLTPATGELVGQGLIQAAICQQPFTQGYESVRRVFDYLLLAEPTGDLIVADEIKILENSRG